MKKLKDWSIKGKFIGTLIYMMASLALIVILASYSLYRMEKAAIDHLNTLLSEGHLEKAEYNSVLASLNTVHKNVYIGVAIVLPIILILLVIDFLILTRYMTRNILEITKAVNVMKEGSFDYEMNRKSAGNDEFGQAIDDYIAMQSTTEEVIGQTSRILAEMSRGDFTAEIKNPEQFVGEYARIAVSFEEIHKNLKNIFQQMNKVANQVTMRSAKIADGSMALSQGSTEQAATVEELTSTITQLSQQIQKNAGDAGDVENFSGQVADEIMEQNKQMSNMLEAMKEIEEKSNQIENIIKAIDDIAFQTNILALNAAVEAARAGNAGKGFAVVADEVRNLAGKSADAASETSSLIEGAITAIHNGSALVTDSAKSLNSVMENAKKSKKLVADIAGEMKNEAAAIGEVTTGLEQISQVVQQNSATAEESSASCQELNNQASSLKQMVDEITV
ncbi:MAG: methyl-accepting chemotaxis protein [Lachnospiraceae bacterium]|nr:methyl-accepting chemotaxis protein [Lachnospiraceae bacterium]